MNLLFAASESLPFLKTGGLADVLPALGRELAKLKHKVFLAIPGYDSVLGSLQHSRPLLTLRHPISGKAVEIVHSHDVKPLHLLVVKQAMFEGKPNPYVDEQGRDWADNAEAFALFSWAVAQLCVARKKMPAIDIAISNDWQTGLLSAYVKSLASLHGGSIKTAHIIHNISFPGIFPASVFPSLDLPAAYFAVEGVEYHGQVSYQKAALYFADKIFTVSPQYAKEIQTSQAYGMGFEGLLSHRGRDVLGILNGVDYDIWSPQRNRHIAVNYSISTLAAKAQNKLDLIRCVGKAEQWDVDRILISAVSRLSEQKGIDIFISYVREYVQHSKFNCIVLGTGDAEMTDALHRLSEKHSNIVFVNRYDEVLSQKIIAGSDVFVMPSRFEPCGLTQLYAMKFGTLPLVTAVGGLRDSVIPFDGASVGEATGFYMGGMSAWHLAESLENIRGVFANKKSIIALRKNAMRSDFSWKKSARLYEQAFTDLIK